MFQHPRTLSKIIQHQSCFYKSPSGAHIFSSAMSKIGIQSFGTCCTKKNSAEQTQRLWICSEQMKSIIRIQRFQNGRIKTQSINSEHSQHAKPNQHHWTEKTSNEFCSELLNDK